MLLKNLKLANFRNFSDLDLDFGNATLFIGKNAQGKSNILESIYFLATSKSPRVEKDSQLIKESEAFCRVEGEVEDKDKALSKLEIVMQFKDLLDEDFVEKRTKVNGISRRLLDYIGNIAVVYFSPEDINLVSGAPSLRRWHIDLTLAQIDKDYKKAITNYTSVISSRNRLLKNIKQGLSKLDELGFWSEQMLENGQIIAQKRLDFFNFLNSTKKQLGQFSFEYGENVLTKQRLGEYLPKELAAANSLIGPHRDDFIFMENNRNLAFFGSRGEQRTAVLSLKLAELEFINTTINDRPLLLLDDVFSELDLEHRSYVASLVPSQQTIISAVEGEKIPDELLQTARVIKVEQGKITDI